MAFYGDSFGGIQSARMADQQLRQQASQQALSMLMRALEQRQVMQQRAAEQAQEQAYRDRVLQMNRDQAAEAARQHAAASQYNERAYREILLPESRARLAQPAAATVSPAEAARVVKFNLENGLDVPDELLKATGPFEQSFRMVKAVQDKDAEKNYLLANEVAAAGNRILRIKKQADALGAAPREGMFRPDLGNQRWAATPYQNPPAIGREMTMRLKPIEDRYKPYLDPKAGYVRLDPATGEYVAVIERPASLAEEGKPTKAAAKAYQPKASPDFYAEVNRLIAAGWDPAEAKRVVMFGVPGIPRLQPAQ